MAILQISRITNRKGLETDLPDPLAGAELGWCTDSRRLFIGNGELADGAPEVGNTEILTEFSDIFTLANSYTYKGQVAGYTVQTGPTLSSPIFQSLQQRLDSYCIATDFGIVGDGATDNTAAINRALYQLYCVDNSNPLVRRSLFFPAGQYVVSNTIKIPPYATLYGEGINNSIISLVISEWSSSVSYDAGVTVVDGASYYTSQTEVPIDIDISETDYWVEVDAPGYVWRTADSNQQIDTDIGAGGATPPTGIEITNMKFSTVTDTDGVLIQDAVQMILNQVAFAGPSTAVSIAADVLADTLPDTAAIRWSSTLALVCSNIVITGCNFNGFTYGTKTDQQIKSVTISNSSFDTLFQGAYLGDSVVINGGATGVKLLHNNFDNIFAQGVVFENVSLNATGYNVFYDVGNDFNGVDYPATSIIEIDGEDNICVGDMFQRTTSIVEEYSLPRINYNNLPNITTVNGYRTNFGTYTRFSGTQETLANNSTDEILFTINAEATRAFKVDYTVLRADATRTGTITIVASTDGSGSNLTFNDNGYENTDTGVVFAAGESAGLVSLLYSVTDEAPDLDAVVNYSITKLA